MSINAISKRTEPLGLEALKQHGLDAFCLIDIRGRQSFEAAHLAHSLHLPHIEDIIHFSHNQNSLFAFESTPPTHISPPPPFSRI